MKRYVTIDFLRGLAIWIMVFLHTLMWIYDYSWANNLAQVKVSMVLLLIVGQFFGGWCGFFLMVSAIGNMISMQKALERGTSPGRLIIRQIVGGILLLIFAMLCESLIGYQGYMGSVVHGDFDNWPIIFWRGYHMEAIHAVAWAVILNGIIQGLLSIKKGYKKTRRNVIIYVILTILVIASTQFVWDAVQLIIPGYPFATDPNTGLSVQYIYPGKSSITDYILRFFLFPIAGHPEPMFPFLASSFIGSIVGIYLTQEHPPRDFPKKGIAVGITMCIVGFIGTAVMVFSGSDDIGTFIQNMWDLPYLNAWLPLYLLLTGSQLGATCLIIRLVEYRGKATQFAKNTVYWRRFGIVAFTIYNFQFFDVIPRWLISVLTPFNTYTGRVNGYVTMVCLLLVFIWWEVILRLWEKVRYIGGMEWILTVIGNLILGEKKDPKVPWWKAAAVDADGILVHPEAIDIIKTDQIDHENLRDSKLSMKVGLCGLLLAPIAPFAWMIASEAEVTEKKNKYTKVAKIMTIIDIVIFIGAYTALSFIVGLPI